MLCPCGTKESFEVCCKPFIEGESLPKTAEELLRSRYVAFVEQNIDYIESTIHPKKIKEFDKPGIQAWSMQSEWKGLTINRAIGGAVTDEEGVVDFQANYLANKQEQAHHEISTFRKVEGKWYFYDGKFVNPNTFKREQVKIGRNDPCYCGSGKKFKKCCGLT